MTELRWLLVGLGLLILVGIYFFWGRKLTLKMPSKSKGHKEDGGVRAEPSLGGTDEFMGHIEGNEPTFSATGDSESHAQGDSGGDSSDKKIVSLHVAAGGSNRFPGSAVVQVLKEQGLRYGKFDIFHRHDDSRQDQVLFSVANMLEPGSFNLNDIANVSTPGVSLFLVLPSPVDGVQVFDDMLRTAKRLATVLGGEVLDGQGSSMSNQTAGHLREEIITYQLQQKRQSL